MNHLFPSPIVIINRRISWSFKVELLIASSSSNISIIQKVVSILSYIRSILYSNLNWKEKIHMNRPNCSIKKEIWLHYASRLQFTIKIVIEIMAMYLNGVKISLELVKVQRIFIKIRWFIWIFMWCHVNLTRWRKWSWSFWTYIRVILQLMWISGFFAKIHLSLKFHVWNIWLFPKANRSWNKYYVWSIYCDG